MSAPLRRVLMAAALLFPDVPARACRDFARQDGVRWTDAEGYTCKAYCGAHWCGQPREVSLGLPGIVKPYVPGKLRLFYTLAKMSKHPHFAATNETMDASKGEDASSFWGQGCSWYPWNAESAIEKLGTLLYVDTSQLRSMLRPTAALTAEFLDACDKAGQLLTEAKSGSMPSALASRRFATWTQQSANMECGSFPTELVGSSSDERTQKGSHMMQAWKDDCNESHSPQPYYECMVSGYLVFLWAANVQGSSQMFFPRANLPADVACCCCGGGTASNAPGAQLRFWIPRTWAESAVFTQPKAGVNWSHYLTGSFVDPELHPDWAREIYPDFDNATREMMARDGIVVSLPRRTHEAEFPGDYPYAAGGIRGPGECEDYRLEEDIENFTLQYREEPHTWVGWAGYTCRYYFYQGSCNADGSQTGDSHDQFGDLAFYYNGQLKDGVVESWNLTGSQQLPQQGLSPVALRRADAFRVCCACGGGRRPRGRGPARLLDVFSLELYLQAPPPRSQQTPLWTWAAIGLIPTAVVVALHKYWSRRVDAESGRLGDSETGSSEDDGDSSTE